MKNSFKGLLVVLAIMMSFVLVQGVWAAAVIDKLEGTATTVANRAIGIDTDDVIETTEVTIYHMGPQSYWEKEVGISYPEVGAALIIEAYDSLNGYVGVRVCYNDVVDACIQLRDPVTLKPLWTKVGETMDLSDTAPEATGDCEPVDHDYDHSYESKGPHGKNF